MTQAAEVVIKALAGGLLVLAFACVAESIEPKRFAGLFGAAPAVAVAGLVVTLGFKSVHDAREAAIGMLAGAAGMVCYAAAAAPLLRAHDGLRASVLALGAWATGTAYVAIAVFL